MKALFNCISMLVSVAYAMLTVHTEPVS